MDPDVSTHRKENQQVEVVEPSMLFSLITKSVLNQLVTELITGHLLLVLEGLYSARSLAERKPWRAQNTKCFTGVLIKHDARVHADISNGEYEKACAKLASREHSFSENKHHAQGPSSHARRGGRAHRVSHN